MIDDDGRDRDPDPDVPEKHWVLDMPDGTTIEGLADSLIRELEAITTVVAGSVFVCRGEPDELLDPSKGEWREITSEEIRRRDAGDW